MKKEYKQQQWDQELQDSLSRVVLLAIEEDSGNRGDLTCRALVPDTARGSAKIIARENGVVAGLLGIPTILDLFFSFYVCSSGTSLRGTKNDSINDQQDEQTFADNQLRWTSEVDDGSAIQKGDCMGVLSGPVSAMLGAERIVLNLLGHLSGIATLTSRLVEQIKGTKAHLYDTRKTLPGWRVLEKYAVHCGGGRNHRMGLFDHVLIKDNHLAYGKEQGFSPAEAVRKAKAYLATCCPTGQELPMIEIEVDTLEQLTAVLVECPDIVLLDNMSPEILRQAVCIRNTSNRRDVQLEASGGITLATIGEIARTGVERISSGAITHSAMQLDFGLDWD